MLAFSRLLVRAAVFLCIRPLLTALSRTGAAALKNAVALSLSPSSKARFVFFTVVRILERALALRWRRSSACLARFRAWLELATLRFDLSLKARSIRLRNRIVNMNVLLHYTNAVALVLYNACKLLKDKEFCSRG